MMGPKGGDLTSALEILNLWQRKSEQEQQRYSVCYRALAKDRQASFASMMQDEAVQSLCKEQGVTHLGGPMLGCLRADGAKIWMRTLRPAKVEVVVDEGGVIKSFGPVQSTRESDLTAIVEVKGLKPGTKNPYRVLIDGQTVAVPMHAAITTPPVDSKAKTRIAFGTCQHRWGIAHPGNTERILKRQPHAMLMYGDVAVQDRNNELSMHRADYALRDFHPTWKDLACCTPLYTSWDDHDYVSGGKDSWGKFDPEGREELFRWIEEHKIGGVLLLSGDRHGARGFRIPRPSGHEFHEFEPASLGGREGPPAKKAEWKTQLYGFESKFAFGEFTFDLAKQDPEVTYRLIEHSGKVLYELTLKRSQITPA